MLSKKIRVIFLLGVFYSCLAFSQVVVVVNNLSGLNYLSKDEVKALFLGYNDVFNETVYITIEITGDPDVMVNFHRLVTDKSMPRLKAHWSKMVFSGTSSPPKRVVTVEQAKQILENNINVVTYMDRKHLDKRFRVIYAPK